LVVRITHMITIDYSSPHFVLTFPYNQEDLKIVRELPLRDWVKAEKVWKVPQLAVKTLDNIHAQWTDEAQSVRKSIDDGLVELIEYKFADAIKNNNGSLLRPYQQIGVNFLAKAKKALLADEMGLGKSIQSIQMIVDSDLKRNLILCPSTLKLNWRNEFLKHFDITPVIISGTKKERIEQWADTGTQYVIANYDLLRLDWEVIPKSWDSIIADEVVYLKHNTSARTKLAKKLESPIRLALSGLPLENNLMEFQSIMEWIRPELVPSAYRFKYRYGVWDYSGKLIGYKNLDELHMLTSPFILRRTKDQVLTELPPKIHTDCPLEMPSAVAKAYNTIKNDFIKWLKNDGKDASNISVLEQTIRLRQFVEFPEIVGFGSVPNLKLEWLKEIYQNIPKIVVFTYFRDSVRLLQEAFDAQYILTGGTPTEERFDLIERFNAEPSGMLIMTDAGRFGLNITGCSTIVNYGNFYNPATMEQREDRLHRIGQTDTVHVLNPYLVGTVDEGIRNIFLKRAGDIKKFIEGSERVSVERMNSRDYAKLVTGG